MSERIIQWTFAGLIIAGFFAGLIIGIVVLGICILCWTW